MTDVIRFLGPNETISMVFHLDITDLQYNCQKAKVPMGPKQPGPTVVIFCQLGHRMICSSSHVHIRNKVLNKRRRYEPFGRAGGQGLL